MCIRRCRRPALSVCSTDVQFFARLIPGRWNLTTGGSIVRTCRVPATSVFYFFASTASGKNEFSQLVELRKVVPSRLLPLLAFCASRCGPICSDAVEGQPDLAHETWCMIRRVMIAALAFAASVCPVSAQDTKVSVDMIGIGRMSCAHWRSTQAHQLEGTIWVYGFWTGLNYVAAASDQTQAKIDVAAIVAQVEKTCAQQTSQTLAGAAWTTYLESKR